MGRRSRFLSSWLLAAVLAGSVVGAGCERRDDRVYDPDHGDYHVWNRDEVAHYNQWTTENHRDPNRDFRKLPPDEQKEYWTWRHSHGDPDHR
ncbi:MAG: hypothetical protein WBC78_12760 [Candidatus Sulfotelmatobacter sp.]